MEVCVIRPHFSCFSEECWWLWTNGANKWSFSWLALVFRHLEALDECFGGINLSKFFLCCRCYFVFSKKGRSFAHKLNLEVLFHSVRRPLPLWPRPWEAADLLFPYRNDLPLCVQMDFSSQNKVPSNCPAVPLIGSFCFTFNHDSLSHDQRQSKVSLTSCFPQCLMDNAVF